MPFASSGNLVTESKEVAISETYDGSNSQEQSDVIIENGVLKLAEYTIPDYEDLLFWYDAQSLSLNDGDDVSVWPDSSPNSYDLEGNSPPSYISSGINGFPSVDFNPIEYLDNTDIPNNNQPNHYFIVFQLNTFDGSSNDFLYNNTQGNNRHSMSNRNGEFSMYAGSDVTGSNTDTQPHYGNAFYNTNNSVLRIDGNQVASGDAGTESLVDIRVGYNAGESDPLDGMIGELFAYPQDKTGIESDIEAYLAAKWGF